MNRAGKATVVIVDRDPECRDLILAFLRQKNFDVVAFESGESALAAGKLAGTVWDALITDFRFTDVSRSEFFNRLKKCFPAIKTVAIHLERSSATGASMIYGGVNPMNSFGINFLELYDRLRATLDCDPLVFSPGHESEHEFSELDRAGGLIGQSGSFLFALDLARRVSASSATVLLLGESGTGKEVFARFIHQNSKCCGGPFVAINCSSIPENLLESELFGHVRGSFTGAHEKRLGLFEAARNGTLFLDEIGDLSPTLQAKLLRVLQERKIKRVGENLEIAINARIISATHRNLRAEIETGHFREDLFFRLNVIPIVLPPLRERREDIQSLAEAFLKKFGSRERVWGKTFSSEALRFMLSYAWPGNVRELENIVERASVLCRTPEILLADLMPRECGEPRDWAGAQEGGLQDAFVLPPAASLPSLEDVINKYIVYAVRRRGGAKDKAARDIGIDRKTLYRHIHASEMMAAGGNREPNVS